jgi:hypothetical protein
MILSIYCRFLQNIAKLFMRKQNQDISNLNRRVALKQLSHVTLGTVAALVMGLSMAAAQAASDGGEVIPP